MGRVFLLDVGGRHERLNHSFLVPVGPVGQFSHKARVVSAFVLKRTLPLPPLDEGGVVLQAVLQIVFTVHHAATRKLIANFNICLLVPGLFLRKLRLDKVERDRAVGDVPRAVAPPGKSKIPALRVHLSLRLFLPPVLVITLDAVRRQGHLFSTGARRFLLPCR